MASLGDRQPSLFFAATSDGARRMGCTLPTPTIAGQLLAGKIGCPGLNTA
ncbi:MAG: hypothetical protein RLZZ247_366, partial [Cyanobacteriota bacterium]